MHESRIKNSVGIWAFQFMPTRFLAAGYHPEYVGMDIVERTRRVVGALDEWVDGFEYHYPGEINEQNAEPIRRALGPHSVYCIASGLHTDPRHALGAFTNPRKEIRDNAIALSHRALDLAADLGSHFIIWPGIEGYNYPFQVDYSVKWGRFLDGLEATIDYAGKKKVKVLLEHKNSEPAMKVLMRDLGMTIYVIGELARRGSDVSHVQINMDWQHLIMNGEHLAEYATILSRRGLLGHQHANSGWGTFDDDNIVGATNFMQTLELALVLRNIGYGESGERIGFDLFPYTEDPVEAVKSSILNWEFICQLTSKFDVAALAEAQAANDAIAAYRTVYRALGLDDALEARVRAFRKG